MPNGEWHASWPWQVRPRWKKRSTAQSFFFHWKKSFLWRKWERGKVRQRFNVCVGVIHSSCLFMGVGITNKCIVLVLVVLQYSWLYWSEMCLVLFACRSYEKKRHFTGPPCAPVHLCTVLSTDCDWRNCRLRTTILLHYTHELSPSFSFSFVACGMSHQQIHSSVS